MKTSVWLISIILTFGLGGNAWAEAVYPKSVPLRLFGMDQQQVGSCMAEAEVSALEHAFAAYGFPIMLSTYHRHAINWVGNSGATNEAALQEFTPEDKAMLPQTGQFIPRYLWPEDGLGFSMVGEKRPSFMGHGVWTPGTPSLPISAVIWLLSRPRGGGGWRNYGIIDFEGIKAHVRAGAPIAVSLHSDLFDHFDRGTGLLTEPYTSAWFPANAKDYVEGDDHRVALVGFDDNLYAEHGYAGGGGAFIIRNSWNSRTEVNASTLAMNRREFRPELEKFRLKIFKDNLPGYYAIPYQYFRDKIAYPYPDQYSASGVGTVVTFNVDYNAAYEIYQRGQNDNPVYSVPFICDRRDMDGLANEFDLHRERMNTSAGKEGMGKFLLKNIIDRQTSPVRFAYLSIAKTKGIDRVRDLARGKYWKYYCGQFGNPARFPSEEDLNDPKFLEILENFRVGETNLTTWYRFFEWWSCKNKGGICL